jgi:hypothetical protein
MNDSANMSPKEEVVDSSSVHRAPKRTDFLFRVFYVGCILLILVEVDMQVTNLLFTESRHEYHALEKLPGFYSWFSFGGILLLVVIAKIMRKYLMRSEDYYDG